MFYGAKIYKITRFQCLNNYRKGNVIKSELLKRIQCTSLKKCVYVLNVNCPFFYLTNWRFEKPVLLIKDLHSSLYINIYILTYKFFNIWFCPYTTYHYHAFSVKLCNLHTSARFHFMQIYLGWNNIFIQGVTRTDRTQDKVWSVLESDDSVSSFSHIQYQGLYPALLISNIKFYIQLYHIQNQGLYIVLPVYPKLRFNSSSTCISNIKVQIQFYLYPITRFISSSIYIQYQGLYLVLSISNIKV